MLNWLKIKSRRIYHDINNVEDAAGGGGGAGDEGNTTDWNEWLPYIMKGKHSQARCAHKHSLTRDSIRTIRTS